MKGNAVILIAEDDEGHYTLMQRNLSRDSLKNEILRFRDGQDLLDYLEHIKKQGDLFPPPHLLFLDIRMPNVDGIAALKKIKSDPLLRRIPVIIITTASDPQYVESCHQLGCSMYLVKPIDYEKFADMMQKVKKCLSIIELPSLAMPC